VLHVLEQSFVAEFKKAFCFLHARATLPCFRGNCYVHLAAILRTSNRGSHNCAGGSTNFSEDIWAHVCNDVVQDFR